MHRAWEIKQENFKGPELPTSQMLLYRHAESSLLLPYYCKGDSQGH